ncbi:hypothetical protein PsorP6_013810 [Peronosclerospora sorghi]|uniref:Uncharacterized protein n=1 Tax=Peronosclerospora sorghi TaxID=230839 RepID=A0ACC0VGP9_9STRA|nr:hypothetical protein PsorP6_013810 [Peronosclerospora sorghi]
MELRQGKLDLQAYAQKTQYLLSNIVYEPVPPAMQVTGFMKVLNDGPVKQSLYRHPPDTLRDAIDMSIREEFSMRSASSHAGYSRKAQQPFAFDMPQRHVNNHQSGRRSSHFVPRNSHPRQSMGGGGPEPMDLSVAVASNKKQPKFKKNIRCNRCAKMGHFAHECMAPRPVPRSKRTEPSAARRHQQGHHPVDAKNGDDKPLITLEVKPHGRDVPMRALFDTGASNNFVRTQSLTMLSFVEVETPLSTLSVRLATGATVTIPKRVIKTRFELNELSFEDEFIVLDLDDKFDVILGIPWMSKFKPSIDWVNLSIGCGGPTGSDHPVCNPALSEDTTAASDSLVDSDGTTRSVPKRSAGGTSDGESPEGLPHAT